ncbi:MAG: PKD domain-containing protein, partial [Planctomycetota bacterium]
AFFPNPDLSGSVLLVEAPVPGKSRHVTGVWLQATNDVSNIEALFYVNPAPPGPPLNQKVLFMSDEEFWSSGGGAPISLPSSENDPPSPDEGLLIYLDFTGGGGGGGPIDDGVHLTITGYDGDSAPPNAPSRPSGNEYPNVDNMDNYQTSTTEPDGEQVYYMWDWGDGQSSSWLGPYPSGAQHDGQHSWSSTGIYHVKVKAKDEWSQESGWSPSLTVDVQP